MLSREGKAGAPEERIEAPGPACSVLAENAGECCGDGTGVWGCSLPTVKITHSFGRRVSSFLRGKLFPAYSDGESGRQKPSQRGASDSFGSLRRVHMNRQRGRSTICPDTSLQDCGTTSGYRADESRRSVISRRTVVQISGCSGTLISGRRRRTDQ